jgi:hypothetical protein
MQSARIQHLSRKEKNSSGPLADTLREDRKITCRTTKSVKYNDFVRTTIEPEVYLLFLRNIPPTLSAMQEKLNDDELPNFKLKHMRTLMKEVGFTYEK